MPALAMMSAPCDSDTSHVARAERQRRPACGRVEATLRTHREATKGLDHKLKAAVDVRDRRLDHFSSRARGSVGGGGTVQMRLQVFPH